MKNSDELAMKISEMKQRIQETDETSEDETFETDPLESSYPALLFGLYKTATKEKLLADLPPRPIADQLMSSFIEKYEPSTGMCFSANRGENDI